MAHPEDDPAPGREKRTGHGDPRPETATGPALPASFRHLARDSAPPSGTSARRSSHRVPAWLFVGAATGTLAAGIFTGQGLLVALGLVLAGVAGHLFTPEFAQKWEQGPPRR